MAEPTMCACGRRLHYSNPNVQAGMCRVIEELGEFIPIQIAGTAATFEVPRHYIALHGIKAREIPELARRYGWKRR